MVIEVMAEEDSEVVKEKIKSKVEAISHFPQDVERPIVSRVDRNDGVLNIAISGEMDSFSIDNLSKEIKNSIVLERF